MTAIENLKPAQIWKHFAEILKIPRSSKNEDHMRKYIVDYVQDKGLDTQIDTVGNILVTVPASTGREQEAILVLQSHIDMVCVKSPDIDFDFDKDPIPTIIDGDILAGDGTTLGADNGIGVAIMLAIIETEGLSHGPLELLFTIDEETGMTGAHNLGPDFFKGRQLLNLDTEEWGEFYISCAGGGDIEISLPVNRTEISATQELFILRVDGLKGGHSGIDINQGRGSAIKILGRLLWHLNKHTGMDLVKIKGGIKRNVIPSDAQASFVTDGATEQEILDIISPIEQTIKEELGSSEPDLTISLKPVEPSAGQRKMVHLSTEKALDLLMALPHGVLTMSVDIPDLVETSCNIGTLRTEDHLIQTVTLVRSAITSKVDDIKDSIESLVKLAGGSVERPRGYPGWKPNPASALLAKASEVFTSELGREPEVKAIHAGLECGIISEKYPGIDMVSIGPDIKGAHTVGENVSISSVQKFWDYLIALLKSPLS